MRAIAFFENQHLSESAMYAERWVDAITDRCFASQGLEPYALVSGMPSLIPEFAQINFGSIEVPDVRQVIRVMFEVPDIPGEDLLLFFAGSGIEGLAKTDASEYTAEQQSYMHVVSGLFGAQQHVFQTGDPEQTEFVSFLAMPNVEESRQYVMVGLLRNAKVAHVQQVFTASPELIREAMRTGSPLPPGLDAAVVAAAMAGIDQPAVAEETEHRGETTSQSFLDEVAYQPEHARGEQPGIITVDESPFIPEPPRGMGCERLASDEATFTAGTDSPSCGSNE